MAKKLKELMETAQGNILDIYYTIYVEYLEPSQEPVSVFEEILQFPWQRNIEDMDSDSARFQKEEVAAAREKYRPFLRSITNMLVQQNPTQQEFYEKLYQNVFNSDLFPEDTDNRVLQLFFLGEEIPLIPYYQAVDVLTLEGEEFVSHVESLLSQLQIATHMLNRPFKQNTEVTSQLCRIAREISTEEDLAVYWAFIFGFILQRKQQQDNNIE